MASTISPNMGLVIPGVGTELSPTWASDLNASLGSIDQHNHTFGQGVPIPPAGLDINSDLTMQGNNLTNVNTVRFTSLGSDLPGTAPNLGCLYVAGNELVYNDESGNIVPITKTGSVNAGAGSITGLPFGTASASYVAANQTFVWQSATNTPANLDAASVTLRNLTANSFGLTINPPSSLGADYSLTEPPPNTTGGTVFLTYDASNNMGIGPAVTSVSPSGTIIMFGGTSVPSGYMLCDGSAISRTTFATLFSVIGQNYGLGNGTTTFNLPDFRGLFPRGVNGSATNDPDAGTRTSVNGSNVGNNVGSFQASQIQSHAHNITGINSAGGTVRATIAGGGTSINYATDAAGGNQTNPSNLYVNFIIKT